MLKLEKKVIMTFLSQNFFYYTFLCRGKCVIFLNSTFSFTNHFLKLGNDQTTIAALL